MDKEINDFKKVLCGEYIDKRNLIEKGFYLNIFIYDEIFHEGWVIKNKLTELGYYTRSFQYDDNNFPSISFPTIKYKPTEKLKELKKSYGYK